MEPDRSKRVICECTLCESAQYVAPSTRREHLRRHGKPSTITQTFDEFIRTRGAVAGGSRSLEPTTPRKRAKKSKHSWRRRKRGRDQSLDGQGNTPRTPRLPLHPITPQQLAQSPARLAQPERPPLPPSPSSPSRPPSPRPPSPRPPSPRPPSPRPPSPQPPLPRPPPAPRQTPDFSTLPAPTDDIATSLKFIQSLKVTSLEETGLPPHIIEQLRDPPTKVPIPDAPTEHGLRTFLDIRNVSVEMYVLVRRSYLHRHPEETFPSLHDTQSFIETQTGIIPFKHDMCVNSCVAFTGPFADLEKCPKCGQDWLNPITKKPHRQFHTFPLGPQLQALWRQPSSAQAMRYRRNKTREILARLQEDPHLPLYDDIYHGAAYLEAVQNGSIGEDDTVVMLSADGAQLYKSKESDCWIYIWVLLDLSPKLRYRERHVLVGAIIPGPKKPGNLDSFLFPGLQHLVALNQDPHGLQIWDSFERRLFRSHIFQFLVCADAVGMAEIDGGVGHHGRRGCRLFCPVPGRRKNLRGIYFPALLLPDYPQAVPGSDHPDVDGSHLPPGNVLEYQEDLLRVLHSTSTASYKSARLETGIARPNIFLGYPKNTILDIPSCFAGDLMHVCALNIPPFIVRLWRGDQDFCDTDDDINTWDWAGLSNDRVWKEHGQLVAAATPYLPGSFDRPPRNIQEKGNSGYKAQEYLTYFYGLGPALFYSKIPDQYWESYCWLVRGVRIVHQKSISTAELIEAHDHLVTFVKEFEKLYYQRKPSRLHFIRQCIHFLLHICPEIFRLGPAACSAQWTLEHLIGKLAGEINQDSNPYMNLSKRGLVHCQINALYAIYPDLQPSDKNCREGSTIDVNLGNGFFLLHASDISPVQLEGAAAITLRSFLEALYDQSVTSQWVPRVRRWAHLQLPNGQIARSRWKEETRENSHVSVRRARFIMFSSPGSTISHYGEVQFFFQVKPPAADENLQTVALISQLAPKYHNLRLRSQNTLILAAYEGEKAFKIIPVMSICAVVAAPPAPDYLNADQIPNLHYIVDRLGFDVSHWNADDVQHQEE